MLSFDYANKTRIGIGNLVGLTEEQVEEMRKKLADRDAKLSTNEASASQVPRWRKILSGTFTLGKYLTLVAFISAVVILLSSAYDDFTKKAPPSITYQESVEQSYKKGRLWCAGLVAARPDLNDYQRNNVQLYFNGGAQSFTCEKLERWYAKHGNMVERFGVSDWKELTFEQKAEWRKLGGWWNYTRDDILEGSGKKIIMEVPCNINIESMPHYGESQLWRADVKRIREWYKQEEERLEDCIKGAIWRDYPGTISAFLDNLFFEKTKEHESLARDLDRYLFERDEKIQSVYQLLLKDRLADWRVAQNKKRTKNINKWKDYSKNKILPALKRGAREERKYNQEIAQKQYAKEFKKEHGMGPNDTCVFKDERGRVKFKGLCKDYVKQRGRLMNQTSGWSAMWEELGEMTQEIKQAKLEKQWAEAEALSRLVLTMNEVKKGTTSYGGDERDTTYTNKAPRRPAEGCQVMPSFGKFEPCLFIEKCTPKPPFKTCSKRNWTKEKACHARVKKEGRQRLEKQYVAYSKSSNCEDDARRLRDTLDGVKRDKGPSYGKDK